MRPRALPFGFSLALHAAVLAWVAAGPVREAVEKRPSLYDMAIRGKEDRIVWYTARSRLPEISPLERRGPSRPPKAEVKAPQTVAATPAARAPRQSTGLAARAADPAAGGAALSQPAGVSRACRAPRASAAAASFRSAARAARRAAARAGAGAAAGAECPVGSRGTAWADGTAAAARVSPTVCRRRARARNPAARAAAGSGGGPEPEAAAAALRGSFEAASAARFRSAACGRTPACGRAGGGGPAADRRSRSRAHRAWLCRNRPPAAARFPPPTAAGRTRRRAGRGHRGRRTWPWRTPRRAA